MAKIDPKKLELIQVMLDDIKPYKFNPREHSAEQVNITAASVRRYGFNNPVLVTPEMVLIAGHCRLMAARQIGLAEVPAIVLPHLSEAEQRAYRIADNSAALKGEWSIENLAVEVSYLLEDDDAFDFNALDLGLETGELDALLASPTGKKTAEVEPEPIPDRTEPPVSRLGDIWTVAGHRILCGDALKEESYATLLGDERAHFAISDMPYNVPVNGHVGGKGKVQHREFPMASGEMSRVEFKSFMLTAFTLQANYSRQGAVNIQWGDWRMAHDLIGIGEQVYDSLLNICVWVKRAGGMGSLWRSQHEFAFAFRVKGGKHVNNVQLGRMGRNRCNVWDYPSPGTFGPERANLALHPTCKNLEMIADAIMDVSNRKDIVLDAFLGSGTTALACQKVGRRCRGIEIDAAYVDLAVTRLAAAASAIPINQDGLTFDEVRDLRAKEIVQ